ncbi:MAG: efflux RND transporter periplasmic adaptor subunit [Gammaproteobacteria bacterium]
MNEATGTASRTLRELVTVLQLEKLVRQCATTQEMAFRIVNDTRRAVPYEQAILWIPGALGRLHPEAATGLSQIDPQAPQLQALSALLAAIAITPEARPLDPAAADPAQPSALRALGYEHSLWCPFRDIEGRPAGGLFLARDTPWAEADVLRLDFLASSYAHAFFHLRAHTGSWRMRRERWLQALGRSRVRAVLALAVLLVLLIPVRQGAVASAEVVAIKPLVLSPPVDGVVASIEVLPNEKVEAGRLLFTLDDRQIRNRHEVALKALEVARADLARAGAKAFSDPQSKAEIAVLAATVEQRAAEVGYTAELLERIRVRAPREGVVLFSDANDWLGRPVSVGERIMTLADEADTELLLWLPVSEAIALQPGAEVRAFLNVDPTRTLRARVRQASYTASPSPEDILAYPVRASFEAEGSGRIGLKATAKVYGNRAPLIYDLLRRPIASLRRWLGW